MHDIATTLAALAPGATIAAVPTALLLTFRPRRANHTRLRALTALLLTFRPRRANHTRLRALTAWALAAASLAGLVTGVVWWLQVLIRIGIAHEDVRTWPAAFAPTVLCMAVIGVVLYQLLLGIGHARRAEERAGPAPTSDPSFARDTADGPHYGAD